MRDCTTKAFAGCTCAERCRIQAEREESKAVFNTLMAKRNADTVQMMVGTVIFAILVSTAFISSALPESNRMAKAQQENVSYAKR
ncbi:hypothetical protein [Neorhizobium sp. AL 9.2.2]|uniref:hypothetical protein n=1 Tax=Neorhizobium sp. AL 9.2.2 TaxID=2712894 RepID=UPI0015731121|nr:hypothetical protein [Neorhizobium sp. AL 9.2.2]NSY17223.1 hypothetical protein [Neorhizobium sp. AL 9.2.2]